MALPSVKLARATLYRPERVSVQETAGILSIKAIGRQPQDIAEKYLDFLTETALLAKRTVDCAPLSKFFLTKKLSTVSASELLQKEDFFVQHRDHELTKLLIDYHTKYGVPIWTVLTEHKFAVDETDVPEEWNAHLLRSSILGLAQSLLHLPVPEDHNLSDILLTLLEDGVYPLALSVPFLIDFYHHFIAEDAEDDIVLGERTPLGIHIKTRFALQEDHSRTICLEAHEIENVAYAAAIALMMDNSGLRFCKCCGRLFIADRPRAEYCSPRCRNVYNTRMSRLRKKEGDTPT